MGRCAVQREEKSDLESVGAAEPEELRQPAAGVNFCSDCYKQPQSRGPLQRGEPCRAIWSGGRF